VLPVKPPPDVSLIDFLASYFLHRPQPPHRFAFASSSSQDAPFGRGALHKEEEKKKKKEEEEAAATEEGGMRTRRSDQLRHPRHPGRLKRRASSLRKDEDL
jgi:hypothetical protein